MYSEKNSRKSFTADLKFSMIFGAVFWLTAIVLYAVVFMFIYSSLRNDNRVAVQVKMLGYWAVDQSGGVDALRDMIDVSLVLSDERPYFVRVSDEFNHTLILEAPNRWKSFEFDRLENMKPEPGTFFALKSSKLNYALETGCIPLTEGKYIQVGVSDEDRRRVLELLSGSFIVALLILVVLSGIVGFLVARRFLMPIRDLEQAVEGVIATGRVESRIVERRGAGELDRLTVSFNEMLGRIEDLVRGMKGALDTVAHDLRTPLTRFRMTAERALSKNDFESDAAAAGEYRTALEHALEESDTVLRMMSLLMDISEAETGTLKLHKKEFSPADKLREIIDVYEIIAEDKGCSIELQQPAWDGTITADPDRFRQAAGNLIDNAVKYGRSGGSVLVRIEADEDHVGIIVRDDGDGISEYDLPEIWKRLYRGKSSKDGLGLGLSLVNAVMKAHGGTAGVESSPGRGAEFRLDFPAGREL